MLGVVSLRKPFAIQLFSFECAETFLRCHRLMIMDWFATADAETGEIYYFNRSTGETTWELPDGVEPGDVPLAVAKAPADDRPSRKDAGTRTILEGWATKSGKGGGAWKRRWIVLNSKTGMMTWFNDNPAYSLSVYKIVEKAKGSMSLSDSKVERLADSDADGAGCPDEFKLKIVTKGRKVVLGFSDAASQAEWESFITASCSATTPGSDKLTSATTHASAIMPRPGVTAKMLTGYMLKAAPGWRKWDRRYFVLDPLAWEMRYFEQGPNYDDIAAVFGVRHPAAVSPAAATNLELVEGEVAENFAKAARGLKGTISLQGSVLGTAGFGETEGGGVLSELPAFTIATSAGRVFRLVTDSEHELQEWIDSISATIVDADKSLALGAKSPSGSALRVTSSSRKERAKVVVTASSRSLAATMDGVTPEEIAEAKALLYSKTDAKAGWLQKSDPRGKHWKRRYFVLRGNVLSYYTDDTRAELKGSVNISSHHWAEAGPGPDMVVGLGKKPAVVFPTAHSMYLGPPSETDPGAGAAQMHFDNITKSSKEPPRAFFMAAESEAGAAAWVQAIVEANNSVRLLDGMAKRILPSHPSAK